MRGWIENELIELINSDQFRLSIPIQFQFRIFQFNSNSIHAELNWIDYQFQFNSWIDPSPVHDIDRRHDNMWWCSGPVQAYIDIFADIAKANQNAIFFC